MATSFSQSLDIELVANRSETATVEAEAIVLQLFDAHAARLRRYAYRCGLPPDAADDVVQDAFLALFRHLQSGGNRDNLPGWLVQVCFRLALKSRHRSARRSAHERPLEGEALNVADEVLSAEAQLLRRQQHKWINAVVRALPERDRQCLWMRAEGVTYRTIADELGISLGAVAKAVARAAARLAHGIGG